MPRRHHPRHRPQRHRSNLEQTILYLRRRARRDVKFGGFGVGRRWAA